ncbi:MAG: relaxase/mobilization nuclease domain-containing protein [Bacteroidales bacterium]|nr:relaxase/mobilization nuclease domain-containing protein [Bacteroidales bacterium]
MIPNITHSTGSGNYLGYNLGDKKEQYQKVQFLAAEGVIIDDRLVERLNQNWVDGDEKSYKAFRKVSMAIANDLDDQFRAQASLNARPKIRAINVSLSFSPEDTDKVNEVVYDETRDDYVPLRLKMGREFLDGMGFGDIQYVAVSHLGTHCAHDHYAINTVRADGSTIKLNFDFVRAQKLAVEIRQKYGLTPPDESLQMITPKAKEALKQSCSWDEYEQRLQEYGIGLVYTDHSKNGRSYGVSYSFKKKVIPGSKLHRSLSYGQVDATLARNLAARQAQEEASRIAAQQELARQKAEAEARTAAKEALRQEQNDIIEGYRSAVLPVGKQLYSTRKSAFELYQEAKDSGIGVSAATAAVLKQLVDTWKQNDDFGRQFREAKYRSDAVKAICGILTCLNPIVGLTAMFLASIAGDIHRASLMAQKKKLLAKVNFLRGELTALEAEKAALKIVKQERLQQYLDAKRMYQEYRNSLQTFDREVKAIESDIRVAEKTPPPAAKPSFEVVLEFKANYYKYRIKKEQDGLLRLQKYVVDETSPVVDGKYTGHCWRTKEKFTSYKEVGHDADGKYFKIKDTADKTRYINQDGNSLSAKKLKSLGLGNGKGMGGRSW